MIVRTVIYHNTQGTHNKQYTILVHEDDTLRGVFSVEGRWGKIGYEAQGSKVYLSSVSRQSAFSKLADMERERENKGYRKVSDSSQLSASGGTVSGSSRPPRPSPTQAPRRITLADVVEAMHKDVAAPEKKPQKRTLRPGAGRQVESEDA